MKLDGKMQSLSPFLLRLISKRENNCHGMRFMFPNCRICWYCYIQPNIFYNVDCVCVVWFFFFNFCSVAALNNHYDIWSIRLHWNWKWYSLMCIAAEYFMEANKTVHCRSVFLSPCICFAEKQQKNGNFVYGAVYSYIGLNRSIYAMEREK